MVAYTLKHHGGGTQGHFDIKTSKKGLHPSDRDFGQNTGDAGFPVIEAGPAANDFRVAWQDNRNGATAYNTWYRRTTDGGATWSTQVRLSDATSGAPYKTAAGYAFPYGDYFDIDVTRRGRTW